MSSKRQNFDIYDRPTELLQLSIPALLVVGYFILKCFNSLPESPVSRAWFIWVSSAIFMNSTHVALSFRNLWLVPEYREVFKAHNISVLKSIAIFFAFFSAFIFFARRSIFSIGPEWNQTMAIFMIFISTAHSLRQTHGISLLYNRRLLSNGSKHIEFSHLRELENKARKIEHRANWILLSAIFFHALRFRVQLFHHYKIYFFWARNIALLGSFLHYAWLMTLIKDRDYQKKKAVFLARYLPHFFMNSFYLASFYSKCVHGSEYLFIDQTIRTKSRAKKVALVGVLFFVILAAFKIQCESDLRFLGLPSLPSFTHNKACLSFGFALANALGYFHFYIDSVIFKMKMPQNRAIIGPLLPNGLEAVPVEEVLQRRAS